MTENKRNDCCGFGNMYINAPKGTEEKIAEQLQTCISLEEPYHRVKGYDSSKPKLKIKMTENKRYSVIHSKTNDDIIMENNCKLIGDTKWDTPKTREDIARLLNEKENLIEELREENKKLKWYYEELRVHVPKETLKLIDGLWNELKGE